MAAEEQPEQANPRVSDPEEYNQTQRLRAINQARQRVEDTIEQSMVKQRTDSSFNESDRQQVVRSAVYSYLSNTFWLMQQAGEDKLIHSQRLGEARIDPPEGLVKIANQDSNGHPRIIGKQSLTPHEVTVTGIKGYVSAPEVFQHTWSLRVEPRHGEPEEVKRTGETYMPVHVSQNAFHAANGFLSRTGIDVELDKGDPHGGV